MRCNRSNIRLVVVMAIMSWAVGANAVDPPEGYPQVDDMLGVETADGHGWLAIRVDFASDSAMDGVVWYNNDAGVVFPTLAAGTGYPDGPGHIDDAVVVATEIVGNSDAWSEHPFDQPVAASLDGLYVIMEFPVGSAFTQRGAGGGPAIGFAAGLTEPAGWISGDGETWHKLAGDFGFAMAPVLVPYEEGMLVKSLGGETDEVPDVPVDYYVSTAPNPFNPRLVIRFGLPQAARTRLSVFDIRGRRVGSLLDEDLAAGHHAVVWDGRDQAGRQTASGVYFVRIVSGDFEHVRRATLVR